ALRSPAVAGSPRAAAIDTEVRAMTGSPQLTQEFYDLAATIFEELAKSSGGDANTMRETLERAAEDPAAFAALLSPATLDRLRALAVNISDRPRSREGGSPRRAPGRVRAGARGGPADRRSPDREGDRSVPEAARPPALVLGYTPPARRDPSDRRHARAAARARVSPPAVTPRDERARGGRLRGGGRVLLDVLSLPGGRGVPLGGGRGAVEPALAAALAPRRGHRAHVGAEGHA